MKLLKNRLLLLLISLWIILIMFSQKLEAQSSNLLLVEKDINILLEIVNDTVDSLKSYSSNVEEVNYSFFDEWESMENPLLLLSKKTPIKTGKFKRTDTSIYSNLLVYGENLRDQLNLFKILIGSTRLDITEEIEYFIIRTTNSLKKCVNEYNVVINIKLNE